MRYLLALFLTASLFSADAEAPKLDRITLTTGGVMVGAIASETDDAYTIKMPNGGTLTVRKDQVKGVEKGVEEPEERKTSAAPVESKRTISERSGAVPVDQAYRSIIDKHCDATLKLADEMMKAMPQLEEIKGSDSVDKMREKNKRNAKLRNYEQLQIRIRLVKEGREQKVPYLVLNQRIYEVMECVIVCEQDIR